MDVAGSQSVALFTCTNAAPKIPAEYGGSQHKGVDFKDKKPTPPSLSPQPQRKKNLIASRTHLDRLSKLHSTARFSNLNRCGRRRYIELRGNNSAETDPKFCRVALKLNLVRPSSLPFAEKIGNSPPW